MGLLTTMFDHLFADPKNKGRVIKVPKGTQVNISVDPRGGRYNDVVNKAFQSQLGLPEGIDAAKFLSSMKYKK